MKKILLDAKKLIVQLDFIVSKCSSNSLTLFRQSYANNPIWKAIENGSYDPFGALTEIARNMGAYYDNIESSVYGLHMFTAGVMKNAYSACNKNLSGFSEIRVNQYQPQGDITPFEDESLSVFKRSDSSTNSFTITNFVERVKEWVDDVKATLENTVFGRLMGLIKCIFKEKFPSIPSTKEIIFEKLGEALDEWIGTPEDLVVKVLGGSLGNMALMAYRAIKKVYSVCQIGYEFFAAFKENDERTKWTNYGKATYNLLEVLLKVLFDYDLSSFTGGEKEEEPSGWKNLFGLFSSDRRKYRKNSKKSRRSRIVKITK
jgi:hypothetical protein